MNYEDTVNALSCTMDLPLDDAFYNKCTVSNKKHVIFSSVTFEYGLY